MASSATAEVVVTPSPRQPGSTGRHVAALFVAALLAAAVWFLLTTVTAGRANAQILGGSDSSLTQPVAPLPGPVTGVVDQTVSPTPGAREGTSGGGAPTSILELTPVTDPVLDQVPIPPPAVTDVVTPVLGEVHDAAPPEVTDIADNLVAGVHDALPPVVTDNTDSLVETVGDVVPPGIVPPALPSDPTPPPNLPGGTTAPSVGGLAMIVGPSASSSGPGLELRLGEPVGSTRGGSLPAPPGTPASPAAPVSDSSGSGSRTGGGRDGPDATLLASILLAAAGAFAVTRARRPSWTDWVALAGAQPG